jgi:ubiquinone/menaquinone biosynthesis C-methylase UbiE
MNKARAQKILKLSRNSYNTIAEEFANSRRNIWPELKHIKDYFSKEKSVLDVGCGNGRFIELWDYNEIRYTGIDNSEQLIERAKTVYGKCGNFIVGDALDLPFDDSSFANILSIAVLHHIPSHVMRLRFFKEIHRVLKPDGTAILTVWKVNRTKYKKQFLISWILKFTGLRDKGDIFMHFGKTKQLRYVHAHTRAGLKHLAAKAGFKIEKSEEIFRPSGECNMLLVLKKL